MPGEDEPPPSSVASSRKGKGKAVDEDALNNALGSDPNGTSKMFSNGAFETTASGASGSATNGISETTPDDPTEATPLLARSTSMARYDGDQSSVKDATPAEDLQAAASARSSSISSSIRLKRASRLGLPSIIACTILITLIIVIMLGAFFVPAAVEEYAKQAAVLEPTNLSLESITATGVQARVRANFRLDGSRVEQDMSRRIGRVATWVVGKLGTDETLVSVYLPEHENILLGTAALPPLTIDVVDGHSTAVDIITELALGDADGIRMVANTWLDGKLDRVRLVGKADISLRSGGIPLGTHGVVESFIVEGQALYRSFAALYFGEKVFF